MARLVKQSVTEMGTDCQIQSQEAVQGRGHRITTAAKAIGHGGLGRAGKLFGRQWLKQDAEQFPKVSGEQVQLHLLALACKLVLRLRQEATVAQVKAALAGERSAGWAVLERVCGSLRRQKRP